MNPAYFLDPCPELEALLVRHFGELRALLRQSPGAEAKVEALILGGGYGRGEGGILRDGDRPSLFNDLDYFLFTRHPRDPELGRVLHAMEALGRETLGIDVDIKCLSVDELGDPSRSMMFYDLVVGHHVVIGDNDFLRRRFPEADPSGIPPIEASRLLWNRGTGLYFASCRIGLRKDAAFVVRNHAKFKLAAGDALLALEGKYDGSCRERLRRFLRIRPDRALGLDLANLHSEGVAFKLSPTLGAPDWTALAEENRRLSALWSTLFLHAESIRLGTRFDSASEYVVGREPRSPELPRWKAPLFALRDGLKYRRWLSPVWDYPRTALFRSLFCLLQAGGADAPLPSPGKFLSPFSRLSLAGKGDAPRSQWEDVYSFWWQRYG